MITAEDDQPGHDAVVVLGFNTWQQRFGADPAIVGRQVDINGRPRTVIGVMPRDFEYPAQAVMWSPLALDARYQSASRLPPSARDRASQRRRAALTRRAPNFRPSPPAWPQQYPDLNADETAFVNPVLEDLVGTVRPALLVLLGAVARCC